MDKKPQLEAVDVGSTDPIFSDGTHPDIAKLIALPLLTRQLPLGLTWTVDQDIKNPSATFLQRCYDPKAKTDTANGNMGFGWAAVHWLDSVGSFLLVRKDKKPLLPLHMEAILKYSQLEVPPRIQNFLGQMDGEVTVKDKELNGQDQPAGFCRVLGQVSGGDGRNGCAFSIRQAHEVSNEIPESLLFGDHGICFGEA